jgi:hypothetical protein
MKNILLKILLVVITITFASSCKAWKAHKAKKSEADTAEVKEVRIPKDRELAPFNNLKLKKDSFSFTGDQIIMMNYFNSEEIHITGTVTVKEKEIINGEPYFYINTYVVDKIIKRKTPCTVDTVFEGEKFLYVSADEEDITYGLYYKRVPTGNYQLQFNMGRMTVNGNSYPIQNITTVGVCELLYVPHIIAKVHTVKGKAGGKTRN